MTAFELGSEASKPNSNNYEHDWKDLEIDYSDVTSTQFTNTHITEEGPSYDVEECGTSNEQDRHIHTGKGDLSSC